MGVLLEYIYQQCYVGAEKQKVLEGLCKTRWSERGISGKRF